MEENELVRLAIILQDSNAKTLERYICLIVEHVLYNVPSHTMKLDELICSIKTTYNLEFVDSEIEHAVKNKGGNSFYIDNNSYSLTPKALARMSSENSLEDKMLACVERFCEFYKIQNIDRTYEIILNHIYCIC